MLFRYVIILLFFLVKIPIGFAQNNSIIGQVVNGQSALPGVTIKTLDGKWSTKSELDGTFRLSGLTVGKHSLQFSYIGYPTIQREVELSSATSTMDLGTVQFAEPRGEDLEEVLIRGTMASTQAKALNIQKTSSAIMNVIASDVIGKLPDRNAAEAVQRIQGVSIERDHGEGRYASVRGTPLQWNSTLINGNRMPTSEGTSDNTSGSRTSPLDIFPSEMIEFVQVSKAITPDMEGDAIGGSINFITRTAPTHKIFKVNAAGGYNGQAQKEIYSGSFLYGDHFFNKKLGFVIGASYWKRNWATDNVESIYNLDDFSMERFELRDYKGVRTTYGINAGLEYNFSPAHKLYFRGLMTDFQDQETAFEHTLDINKSSMSQRRREGLIGIGLTGGELGGNHDLFQDKVNLKWKASTYQTDMETRRPDGSTNAKPTYKMAVFSSKVDYANLANDGKMYLDLDAPSGYTGTTFRKFLPQFKTAITDKDLRISQLIEMQLQSFERDRIAEADVKYQVASWLSIKVGGKYKSKYLRRGNPMDIYINTALKTTVADLEQEKYNYNGGFLNETGVDYASVQLPGINLRQLDALLEDNYLKEGKFYHLKRDDSSPDSAPSFYSGTENVWASYGMFEGKITDQIQLVGGVRYEHTDLAYNGNEVISKKVDGKDVFEINPVRNTSSFGAFLPMVHLKYQPIEPMNIRLAYTRTFARANFSDLNPTESVNLIFTPPVITRGNINLKPTFANNFDLMTEYFFQDIGVASFGAFYKGLSNVIYSSQTFQTIDGVQHRVVQPENSEKGWLAGFEAGISKRMSFLPGFWKSFGVDVNYTFTTSEMNVPRYEVDAQGKVQVEIAKEALPSQSKHLFNTALFYENDKFMARLAGNYKGAALALVQGNPENYRWYGANFTVDFSANYKINKKVNLFLELNNLNNAAMQYYHGDQRRLEQLEYYSQRGLIGINYQIF